MILCELGSHFIPSGHNERVKVHFCWWHSLTPHSTTCGLVLQSDEAPELPKLSNIRKGF
jgi:hypothetical protein